MSGPILFGDAFIATPSARISGDDVRQFRDVGELLSEAKVIRDAAEAEAEAARAQGYADGKAAAQAEFADALGTALDELGASFAAEHQRREREVSRAAMAVIEQLIGTYPADEIVAGLAAQALHTAGAGEDDCVVEVAPVVAEAVSLRLADARQPMRVIANPDLPALACRVVTGEGRIIADLDKQLASLRERWGIDAAERAGS